jgi:mRNA interferase MazF
MICKRGEIVVALFPDSNMRSAKPRPVLVVQADNLTTGISQLIVAMITSKLSRAGHPSRVTVSVATTHRQMTGLRQDSIIMMYNL